MAKIEDRREFLQLAQVFDPKRHTVGGWFLSEKMDGQRAFWDGGITRGIPCYEIPFANTAKDGIRVVAPVATGLWSRYGKPIQAPMWFLDALPKYPLDGELTMGRGTFQQLMSACRKLKPVDSEWERVKYMVFDLPDYTRVFADGTINVPNFEKKIRDVMQWLAGQKLYRNHEPKLRRFETVVHLLNKFHPYDETSIVQSLPQEQLPFTTPKAIDVVNRTLDLVTSEGGEGLILRHHNSIWEPKRTWNLLKVKPFQDAEVTVKGYIWGRETDRGSKLLGLMGAMIVDFDGKRLELSGFTDAERSLTSTSDVDTEEGFKFPGERASEGWTNERFPIGSRVTIRYRELTNDGLPKEARYWRHRPSE